MIAEHQKKRRGLTNLAEQIALGQVLRLGIGIGLVFIGHKGVAQIDREIGLVSALVGQGLQVNLWIGVGIQMRIGLNGEGERAASRALGGKRLGVRGCKVTRTASIIRAIAHPVGVAGIGLQSSHYDFRQAGWR